MNTAVQFLIWIYQHSLKFIFLGSCRYYPSCSEYAKVCYTQYSFLKASQRTLNRICRCHPYAPGGVDLP